MKYSAKSGWENATEEELAELIHNNMRKKVASIASDPESTFGPNSSLVYEKPDTDVNRFSLKNRGTNLIKWKASRADQELIRLFAQSVNESYKNQGSNTLRGVGGFQSEKKSEERFLGLMGITYFATLNKIN